jgi:hypothetical protein
MPTRIADHPDVDLPCDLLKFLGAFARKWRLVVLPALFYFYGYDDARFRVHQLKIPGIPITALQDQGLSWISFARATCLDLAR